MRFFRIGRLTPPPPPAEHALPDADAYAALRLDPEVDAILRDAEEELGRLQYRTDCPDRGVWKEYATKGVPLPDDLAEHKANCQACYITHAAFWAAPRADAMARDLVALLADLEDDPADAVPTRARVPQISPRRRSEPRYGGSVARLLAGGTDANSVGQALGVCFGTEAERETQKVAAR